MSEAGETPIRVATTAGAARDWSLALVSQGLAVRVAPAEGGWGVWVPSEDAGRARALLELYLRENRAASAAPVPPSWPAGGAFRAAAATVAGLLFFFLLSGPAAPDSPWLERGAASARILTGEPWRALTALTLHTGIAHLLANTVSGLFFFGLVFRALGPGLGGSLLLAAGTLGNIANAALGSSAYLSVGASTAVFGAIGLLAGLATRRELPGRRPVWAIAGAALALLAMLGTGGPRTDFGAHLFGLAAGGALGAVVGSGLRAPPGRGAQLAWGGLALALVGSAWARAWGGIP